MITVRGETMDFLSEIEKRIDSFSKKQRLLALYIKDHGTAASAMTATALAEASGVSEPTVVRFASEMGFTGYGEMREALKESLRGRLTSVERMTVTNEYFGEGDLLSSVLRADAEKIMTTLGELDKAHFEKSVEMLISAEKIYIIGMRSSAFPAGFLNYYLRLLCDNVHLVCPTGTGETFEQLVGVKAGDAVFAISFPRYSTATVKAVEYAHDMGACVIVLTDRESSPVAKYADAVLTAKSEMASFVDSMAAPMSIINAIIAYIGAKMPERSTKRLRHLEEVWNEYGVYAK